MAVQEHESCQTELHPVGKNIDRGYEWNEWEHRRKALAMVNLRQKRTHGSQTILSHYRRENATQVCSTQLLWSLAACYHVLVWLPSIPCVPCCKLLQGLEWPLFLL